MIKLKKFIVIGLACILTLSCCACGGFNDNGEYSTPQEQTYTIQYTDGAGIHSIDVQSGKLYSISTIPQRNGYVFLGLYDAEVGGTQYINAGGSAVSVFTDNSDIVLYPQFKAKEYTLILDYQGAAVTGSRSVKVAYDSEIIELPLNLTLENKIFQGWYTEPNRKGNQIADQYGVLPENRKVTEKLFDLSDPDGNIKLYAGFKSEEFTVTFYLTENSEPEEIKVEYGTPISEVQPETRVDGKAVLVWSKKRNDTNKEQAFTGKVTSDMVLYAAELAPIIEFDSNGGNEVNSLVVRAGNIIKLPTAIRENYKFVGWQDVSGNAVNYSTMPENSVTLYAKWQAKLVFDSNGGSDVDDISVEPGNKITLPTPERNGFIFAGWYTTDKDKYTSTTMPATGIKLKAGWYQVKEEETTVISPLEQNSANSVHSPALNKLFYTISHSKYAEIGQSVALNITWCVKFKRTVENAQTVHANYYSSKNVSSNYLFHTETFNNVVDTYRQYSWTTTFTVSDDFYVCFYDDGQGDVTLYLQDFYYIVSYVDIKNLYL